MGHRAKPSGVTLNADDAAIIKGMLERGDRQHDIAAWFGVNSGRVAEIATGQQFANVDPAASQLPPVGPYPGARHVAAMIEALAAAKVALGLAEASLGPFPSSKV